MIRFHLPNRVSRSMFASLAIVSLSACAPVLGPEISLSELPPVQSPVGAKVGLGQSIALAGVEDGRNMTAQENVTQAVGNVTGLVEDSIRDVVKGNGFTVSPGARYSLHTKITKWHTKVETTSSTKVESQAAISVEVKDKDKLVYTGTYNGSRSATTPVASKNDIRFSLGTAMTEAVNQIVEDEKLVRLVVGR